MSKQHEWVTTSLDILEKLELATLKSFIKASPCLVCGGRGVDVDHIKTRGSGGTDECFNLWPLCRRCHSEKHSKGLSTFILQNPNLKKRLFELGWQIDPFTKRLFHPKEKP